MKFLSQYKQYKLWIEPSYYATDNTGKRFFHAGVCAKFMNGIYETEDKKIIEALLKDRMCGQDYAPVRVDVATTIPTPEIAATTPNNYDWAQKEIKPAETDIEGFKCPTCGKVCKTKLALSGHMRMHK